MRSRSTTLATLALLSMLPGVGGCLGHSAELRRGDEALAKQDYATAMKAYTSVLTDEREEEQDKDAAERSFERAWRAQTAEKRAAEEAEMTSLEGDAREPLAILAAVRPLAARIRSHANSDELYARAKALAARLAPAAWASVERHLNADAYLEAERDALTVASAPGVAAEYASRLAGVRARGAAFHAGRAAEASSRPHAAALHRALAAHFGGNAIPAAGELLADAQVRFDATFEGPDECASTTAALRNALASRLPSGRGFPVAVEVRLARCNASESRRTERRTSTFVERRLVGSHTETQLVTVTECHDVVKETSRNVAVGSSTTYTQSMGVGGVVHTTPNTQIKYETQKSSQVVTECGPVSRQQQVVVNDYADVTHNDPYTVTQRTLAARIEGTLRARTEGDADHEAPLVATDTTTEEAYDRPTAVGVFQTRKFTSLTPDAMLRAQQAAAVRALEGVGAKQRLAHAERLLREAERAPAGVERDDLLVRASLLGSPGAPTLLRVTSAQLSKLFDKNDPFGSGAPEPEPRAPDTTADDVRFPVRSKSRSGFTSSNHMEATIGSITTGDLAIGGGAGAASGAAPGATFRESATTLGGLWKFPVFGAKFEKPAGFTFLDELGGSAAIVVGSSAPPTEDVAPTAPSFQAWAGYTAMVGVRLGGLGLFGGARAQAEFVSTGYVETNGARSVPLCARAEYRVRGEFVPRTTVCAMPIVGLDRTSAELVIPFSSQNHTLHALGRYDSLTADVTVGELSSAGVKDGRTTIDSMVFGIGWTN